MDAGIRSARAVAQGQKIDATVSECMERACFHVFQNANKNTSSIASSRKPSINTRKDKKIWEPPSD